MNEQTPALSGDEVAEVLRYWLAALRVEESLAVRPRVHRVDPGRGLHVDLQEPDAGQEYCKLSLAEGAGLMLRSRTTVVLPLDAERAAFCEHFVRVAWWEELAAQRGGEPPSTAWLLAFPVVHFAGREELAGLLRFRLTLGWQTAAGRPWKPPTWRERHRRGGGSPIGHPAGATMPPVLPTAMTLMPEEEDEGGLLPYSLDTYLLTNSLGVTSEEVEDFFLALRQVADLQPGHLIRAVCELLEARNGWSGELPTAADPERCPPEALVTRLVAAMRARLTDHRIHPLALIYDGSKVQATLHVQRELSALLRTSPGAAPWDRRSALWCYLSGARPAARAAPAHGRFTAHPLSPEQLAAAELCRGSRLAAVQGPPGTGKTELILNLAAGQLVERVRALARSSDGTLGQDWLVVASTNNRAVDQVLDPLSLQLPADRLPLALRVGNRDVMVTAAVPLLDRCLQWLDRQPGTGRAELEAAVAAFRQTLAEAEGADAPFRAARAAAARRQELTEQLAALEALPGGEAVVADEPLAQDTQRRLRSLQRRLGNLRGLAAGGDRPALEAVQTLWDSIARTNLRRLDKKLKKLGLAPLSPRSDEFPPPAVGVSLDELLEMWDEGAEWLADRAQQVREELTARLRQGSRLQQLDRLRRELALLPALPAAGSAPAGGEGGVEGADPTAVRPDRFHGLELRLFEQAEQVRERWAVLHRVALRTALEQARTTLAETRSLRRFLEEEVAAADWLRRLFPVLGCTLLSLGNAFPVEAEAFQQLVIDEAGQCHPAYALSGLLRAHQALIIGDVHQLEPVVRLVAADEERVRRHARITLSPERLRPYRVLDPASASAQSLADRAVGAARPTLRDHYRCQAEIIELSNLLCGYGLRVRTPRRALTHQVPWLAGPVLLLPVRGEQCRAGGSWTNPAEAERVVHLLGELLRGGVPPGDVAVITPYVGQLELLRRTLRRAGFPLDAEHARDRLLPQETLFDELHPASLALGTVHRFQGGERSVVLFSTVVTRPRSLPFLNERVNLINVAVSRARDHLVILGDPVVLQGGRCTRLLVDRSLHLA